MPKQETVRVWARENARPCASAACVPSDRAHGPGVRDTTVRENNFTGDAAGEIRYLGRCAIAAGDASGDCSRSGTVMAIARHVIYGIAGVVLCFIPALYTLHRVHNIQYY